ncbi:hypothetical protein MMC11_003230 [Xylographa trunciseda]|nr:hypothetical protein [Xylographa trunciseda]
MPLQVCQILVVVDKDAELDTNNQLARSRCDAGGNEDLRGRLLPALAIPVRKSVKWDSVLRTVAMGPHDQLAETEIEEITPNPHELDTVALDTSFYGVEHGPARLIAWELVQLSAMELVAVMAIHEVGVISFYGREEGFLLRAMSRVPEVVPISRANGHEGEAVA